jgi:multiple sugar transport system permease protein
MYGEQALRTSARSRRRHFRWREERLVRIISVLLLLPGIAFVLLPVVWMLAVSLEDMSQVLAFPPTFLPRPFVWDNYAKGLTALPFGRYFLNSAQFAVLRVVGAVLSASLAGFAFARLRSPDRGLLFALVLSTMMLPYTVTMIPQFVLFKSIGWTDSYRPLIVPAFLHSSPFIIFLFRQFFRSIPEEVFEAAKIDGCSYPQLYWRIMLPLSLPVLATAAILVFQATWDDLLGPLIYINSNSKYPLSLGLATMRSSLGASPWNEIMAVSIVAALPPILLFAFFQRYVISGVVVTSK